MNLETVLHTYRFDIGIAEQATKYNALHTRLRETNGKCFNVLEIPPFNREKVQPGPVTLETKFLFSNQWNGTTNRLFDWYESIYPNRSIKEGYWLEITEEMRAIRRDTLQCGYCGSFFASGSREFCGNCLDSPYLKETELHLLRLMPVSYHFPKRQPLTEAELASLLPAYVLRQTTGNDSRAAQRLVSIRKSVEEKFQKSMAAIAIEHNGMLWLLDHSVSVENCIYYSHTQTFSFGWQAPVSSSVANALREKLTGFPYTFEIKEFAEIHGARS